MFISVDLFSLGVLIKGWEQMSHNGESPKHVPGWQAGDTGSKLYPRRDQRLAGPWINGQDPADKVAAS